MVEGEDRLRDALRALQEGRATDDPLNGLILIEGLDWREVEVLRTLRNHLLQIRPVLNAETVNGVLVRNCSAAAAHLPRLRRALRSGLPGQARSGHRARRRGAARRDARRRQPVRRRDPARRSRTWCTRRCAPTPISGRSGRWSRSRWRAARSTAWSSPRPLFEIYVHSRKLEGIHLRGGMVARGGLRWSDRHDDFRTEILGLMKTQHAEERDHRPGRVEGRLRAEGPAAAAAGARHLSDRALPRVRLRPARRHRQPGATARWCIRRTSSATTTTTPTWSSPPTRARRTCRTPPTQVSAQYGFWLGDAFASGGSNGYDHKREGITARGAWECVRHHFRKLGVDVQTQPFTVRRHRRHGRRRVRQRHAAQQGDPAGRGLQSPAPVPRPVARSGEELRRARRGCSRCRARRGRTTTRPRSARAAASSSAPPRKCRSAPQARDAARHRRRRRRAARK